MDKDFLNRMKEISSIMKYRQEKYGHEKMAVQIQTALEISDFIELVRIAEEYEIYKRNTDSLLENVNHQLDVLESEVESLRKCLKESR